MAIKNKKRKRKVVVECGKLYFDRLFDKARVELTHNCFQNERVTNYELYKAQLVDYICTLKPKRMFFVDNNILVDSGAKIYFRFNTLEKYEAFKEMLWKYFQKIYFISPKLYPTTNKEKGIVEGYILLLNQREKDMNKHLKETAAEK